MSVELCRHVHHSRRFSWVCIRPFHDWTDASGPHVVAHRRARGLISNPDRHVYIRATESNA